jgi:hypothetical protein
MYLDRRSVCVCVCVCVCVGGGGGAGGSQSFNQDAGKGFCAQVESGKIWDIHFYPSY